MVWSHSTSKLMFLSPISNFNHKNSKLPQVAKFKLLCFRLPFFNFKIRKMYFRTSNLKIQCSNIKLRIWNSKPQVSLFFANDFQNSYFKSFVSESVRTCFSDCCFFIVGCLVFRFGTVSEFSIEHLKVCRWWDPGRVGFLRHTVPRCKMNVSKKF